MDTGAHMVGLCDESGRPIFLSVEYVGELPCWRMGRFSSSILFLC